jgi:hypothetical protein
MRLSRPHRVAPVLVAVLLTAGGCGPTSPGVAGGDGGGADGPRLDGGGGGDGGGGCAPAATDLEGCACATPGGTRPCWPGSADPAARGVGPCRDGAQTCTSTDEFVAWGPCTGAVLPAAEVCGDGVDNDCDSAPDCFDLDCGTFPTCVPECAPGQTEPCYSGPAGTSGVGACKPGLRTCDPDGKWDPDCVGQVLPGATEGVLHGNCGDGLDNDCNGKTDCDELGCLVAPGCQAQPCTPAETRPCYTGPAGTKDVGLCHGGTQTCASDGKSWGPCQGEVTPSNEGLACTDGLDNNCNNLVDCDDPACVTAPSCCTPAGGTVDETIWANSSSDLYRVDPTTFAVTHVGAFGAGESITDIAVTPAGELYGISFTSLYRVDKTTGHATYVAALSGSSNNGLTFLPSGALLAASGAGDVSSINPSTGGTTAIGNFGNGLSSSGDLVAVGPVMYGISSTSSGGSDASQSNVLLRVDVATGVATVVGPIGYGQVWGLAFVGARVIGFNTSGQIIEIDPQTGAGTLLATRNVQFWGAGMSPDVPVNPCP